VAMKMLNLGLDPERTPEAFRDMLEHIQMRFAGGTPGNPEIEVDGVFPGEKLRTREVSAQASRVSAIPEVRRRLVELQREMAGHDLLVMEGRDIGTAVFPDACCKIFLTASPETRARRRLLQDGCEPDPALLKKTAEEIAARDYADSTRAISPLKQADDAVLLDNSDLNLEETAQAVLRIFREKCR